MARPAPRHDRDAGGPADLLAAKAALRQEVWSAMRTAKVADRAEAGGRHTAQDGPQRDAEKDSMTGKPGLNPHSGRAAIPGRGTTMRPGIAYPSNTGPEPYGFQPFSCFATESDAAP
jgi:5-formyltetrahydrofolate cyclo-ligase